MSDKIKAILAYILCFIVGIICIWVGIIIKQTSIKATATITEVDSNNMVSVEFLVDERKCEEKINSELPKKMDKGDKITVYYDKNDLTDVSLYKENDAWIILFIIGVFAVSIPVVNVIYMPLVGKDPFKVTRNVDDIEGGN